MNFIWDTTILVHYIRNSRQFASLNKQYNLFSNVNKNLLSVVSIGEIYSLTLQLDWKQKKLSILQNLLSNIKVLPIGRKEIIRQYAAIDAFSQSKHPTKKGNFTARNMGKNDLWIAATASALNLTLLTTDHDFSHLNMTFLDVKLIEFDPS